MPELTLYFIKNATQNEWIGNPLHGAEPVDWPDAHAYASPGDALSVMDQLSRAARAEARSLRRRIVGFLSQTHQGPDEFVIVPLGLDEPSADDVQDAESVDAVGQVVEAPADDEGFEEPEERLETGIERAARQRVEAARGRARGLPKWPQSYPPLWSWSTPAAEKDAA